MMEDENTADYGIEELLALLNEGVIDVEFVKDTLAASAGNRLELVKNSDGGYDILTVH
jgi:hypothetical protein